MRHSIISLWIALASAACAYTVDEANVEGVDDELQAAAGSLDPTFGTAGKVTTAVSVGGGGVYAALQSDGKIIVAVTLQDTQTGNPALFGVVRYNANGALDSTFGNAGVARSVFTNKAATVNGVTLTADGKIVVYGEASFTSVSPTGQNTRIQLALARFTSSGALDSGFGQAGQVTTNVLGNFDRTTAAVMQADGSLLVAGSALTSFNKNAPTNTALVRYLTNGALDSSFGQAGIVSSPGVTGVDALALQSDGSILVLNGATATPRVARFSAQGSPIALALAGTLGPISAADFTRTTFQRDGKVLLTNAVRGINRRTFLVQLQRFTLAGALDGTFNNPAFSYVPQVSNTSSLIQAFALRGDGRIIVAGVAPTAVGEQSFGLASLSASGALDPAFGNAGTSSTRFTGSDQATALLLQPDGKLIAIGESGTSTAESLSLARYVGM